jgi:hypothetical protein
MSYIQRIATLEDISAIAPLWKAFAEARSLADPLSMPLIRDFDYERYVADQLAKPLSFCFVLESEKELVGFISIYLYDEAPPSDLPSDLEILNNPFKPRRVGAVLGLYVQELHRKIETIKLLIDAATKKAESLKITDIDVLVSQDQTGVHALLEKTGFTKSAVQYTKHYEINETNLPSLHLHHRELQQIDISKPEAIPLKDPLTNEIVHNLAGETMYLEPVKDENGTILKSCRGLPIYPPPVRDPQTQNWVFDNSGNLLVAPLLFDEKGEIIEIDGIPKFKSPVYDYENGKLSLKVDEEGKYMFK